MYCTIVILCLECFHCYVIIIDCLLTSFDMLYFSTDGCINKSLTYLLTYCLKTLLPPKKITDYVLRNSETSYVLPLCSLNVLNVNLLIGVFLHYRLPH